MSVIAYLEGNMAALLVATAVFGLIIGSFLNVVIYRLPIMIEREWQSHCAEILKNETGKQDTPSRFDLLVPRSCCPQCGHSISALENIPVVSYLFLKGKCISCGAPISIRYPLVEILTATLSVVVTWHFGLGWPMAGALLLTWALVALSFIDFRDQLLPDSITLPMLWTGIGLSFFGLYTDTTSSVIGAMVGYLILWSIFHLFKLLTRKEGMGYGDFKLLAMLGAWMGWKMLPLVVLLSSLLGAIIGIALILTRKQESSVPIPFGPYLALAGWIGFLWGEDIIDLYLGWSNWT